MNYFKMVILAFAVTVGAIVVMTFFVSDPSVQLKKAEESFAKGNIEQAETALQRGRRSLSVPEWHLYESYLARARGDLKRSTEEIRVGLESVKPGSKGDAAMTELYVNGCLNAYLTHDMVPMKALLGEARTRCGSNEWFTFFEAITLYDRSEDLVRADALFQQSENKVPLSEWMRTAFDKVFTPSWVALCHARCDVAQGKYLAVRQRMAPWWNQLSPDQKNDLCLILAWSYLKEAEEKPLEERHTYYQVALSYLDRTSFQADQYHKDREQCLAAVREYGETLLREGDYDRLVFVFHCLEKGEAREQTRALTAHLVAAMEQHRRLGEWNQVQQLGTLLDLVVRDSAERNLLGQRLDQIVKELLEEERASEVSFYWQMARRFTSEPEVAAAEMGALAWSKTLAALDSKKVDLSEVEGYLSLWTRVEKDPEKRLAAAQTLLAQAQVLWRETGQEANALQMMKTSADLPLEADQEVFRADLAATFHLLATQAVHSNELRKLGVLLSVSQTGSFGEVEGLKSEAVPRLLEAANTLAQQHRYDLASEYLAWLLYLDPENAQARALLAQCYYGRGFYQEALKEWGTYPGEDRQLQEAYAVAEFFGKSRMAGALILSELESRRALSRESLLRLGYGLLEEQQPVEALKWLDKILPSDDEVLIGRCYAAYLQGKWEEVLKNGGFLLAYPGRYPEMEGMRAKVWWLSGHEEEAESAFQRVANREAYGQETVGSDPFLIFRKRVLQNFNLSLVACDYYLQAKHQPEMALSCLQKSSLSRVPVTEGFVLRARAWASLNDLKSAMSEVASASASLQDVASQRHYLPELALLSLKGSDVYRARDLLETLASLGPLSMPQKLLVAKVSMALRNYQEALDQFLDLREASAFPVECYDAYVECLLRTNHFQEAYEQASLWLQDRSLPLLQQLRLTRQLSLRGGEVKAFEALCLAARQPEEKAEVVELCCDVGDYDKAAETVKTEREALMGLAEGRQALFRFYLSIGHEEEAQALSDRLVAEGCEQEEVLATWYRGRELSHLETMLQELTDARLRNPGEDAEAWMSHCRHLLALYPEIRSSHLSSLGYQEIVQTEKLFSAWVSKEEESAEMFYLQGQLLKVLHRDNQALAALQRAVAMDATYAEALGTMAELQQRSGRSDQAIQLLSRAVALDPTKAQAWASLAWLQMQAGNLDQAKSDMLRALVYRPQEVGYRAFLNQMGEIEEDPLSLWVE